MWFEFIKKLEIIIYKTSDSTITHAELSNIDDIILAIGDITNFTPQQKHMLHNEIVLIEERIKNVINDLSKKVPTINNNVDMFTIKL